MHTRAAELHTRFGHKGSVQAMMLGNRLDRKFERHNVVRRRERLIIAEIHFML